MLTTTDWGGVPTLTGSNLLRDYEASSSQEWYDNRAMVFLICSRFVPLVP